LTVDITRSLTESDYIVKIVDPDTQYDSSGNVIPSSNHWYSDLGFTTSTYILNDLSGGGTIATVKASNYINSNEMVLDASNNYFYIQPIVNSNGGVYSSTEENVIKITIDLEYGAYSRAVILAALQESLTNNSITTGSTIKTYYDSSLNDYSKFRLNINKIFRTSDYKIVFYDLLSFSHCNFGNTKSLQNITSDTTLGWIIGFRSKTEYITTPGNISYNTSFTPATTYYTDSSTTAYTYNTTTNVATITGDTTISINLYNYFLIVLDDYTQNHLNDGLVTITATDSSIALPSYASRAITRCNPSTKETYMNSNILTSKQIYAANEILKNKQSTKNINSLGPFVQDIFGIIPMKTSGLQPGASYIEFGGTLQNQDRTYFGPVNIRRMSIKLLNDKGNVVDLNNSDWSFSLIAEQLYNPNTNSSKK
jgi:hypothetical protein